MLAMQTYIYAHFSENSQLANTLLASGQVQAESPAAALAAVLPGSDPDVASDVLAVQAFPDSFWVVATNADTLLAYLAEQACIIMPELDVWTRDFKTAKGL